ncbi:hypothetical protein CEE37_13840 [candidate division LCP-89 bacterium B3_LCP]|uniref:SxtJ n=1 Tax=candidate division LCP-89 bacterium B3_LCP TaxID=2012998 RepID=A0A532URL5_UNCL8|nr:MAG: hypothetical protein CEE37_13840 [candidate division LCP-89 bacterium B3_LCP]
MSIQYTKKEIRTWALVMAAILAAVGTIQFFVWSHIQTASVLWIISAAFLLTGLLIPKLLKPIFWLWLKLATALAWLNTRLILGIVFFLVFTPVGLLLRLLRKDLLKERWDSDASSYWIRRSDKPMDPQSYEKQY